MSPARRAMTVLLLVPALCLSWGACTHAGRAPEPRGAAACPTEAPRAELLLRVVDVKDRPIPGASIAFGQGAPDPSTPSHPEEVVVTDAEGKARLTPRVEPGRHPAVYVNAEGYLNEIRGLDLLPGVLQHLDVRLWRSAAVSGRVLDARGRPLQGVEVTGRRVAGYRGAGPIQTDAEGRFTLEGLAEGPVVVSASWNGWLHARVEVVAPRSGLELSWPVSAVSVEVRDDQGQPLREAFVRVQALDASGTVRWMDAPRPDAQGRAELDRLPPGPVRLMARWPQQGFEWMAFKDLTLLPGQRDTVVLSFQGRRVRPPLTGTVTDEQGRPLSGVAVRATPPPSPGPVSLPGSEEAFEQSQDTTDDQGRFTLRGLREGPVRVSATEASRRFVESPPVEVPPGKDTVSRVLTRGSTLQGDVVGPEGKPLSEVSVWVNGEPAYNPSGRLEDVAVPEGRATVMLFAEGFAVAERTVQVPKRKAFRLTEPIVLQPARTVSGRVLREDGCTPIANAVVMLDREHVPNDDLRDLLATRTDADGRFELMHLERAPLTLRVLDRPMPLWGSRGEVRELRRPVAADEDAVTVRFGPEASLTGVVRDSDGRPLDSALLGGTCRSPYASLDAAGRYALHGLEGGRECFLAGYVPRETWAAEHATPVPVFTPRRVVLPERGTLRVDLTARRGPAALKVHLPRRDLSAVLLAGAVRRPETWAQAVRLSQGALKADPDSRLLLEPAGPPEAPTEVSFRQLSPGSYTLLVVRSLPDSTKVAVVLLPVTLDGPGTKQVAVNLATAHLLETE
jgi:protocatechuate 3,4-dioxygenase beta subunit